MDKQNRLLKHQSWHGPSITPKNPCLIFLHLALLPPSRLITIIYFYFFYFYSYCYFYFYFYLFYYYFFYYYSSTIILCFALLCPMSFVTPKPKRPRETVFGLRDESRCEVCSWSSKLVPFTRYILGASGVEIGLKECFGILLECKKMLFFKLNIFQELDFLMCFVVAPVFWCLFQMDFLQSRKSNHEWIKTIERIQQHIIILIKPLNPPTKSWNLWSYLKKEKLQPQITKELSDQMRRTLRRTL